MVSCLQSLTQRSRISACGVGRLLLLPIARTGYHCWCDAALLSFCDIEYITRSCYDHSGLQLCMHCSLALRVVLGKLPVIVLSTGKGRV